MKRLNLNKIILTIILLTAITFRASSQCMVVPVSLDKRVNQSSIIVEGIITGERATWDDGKKKIFTIYTIEVTTVFKGSAPATIEVATWGGTVGDTRMTSTNTVKAGKGSAGVFMLYPSKQNIASRGTLYECYSDMQGFLKYDRSNKSAKSVFDKYASVENNLYPLLESKTGHARQVRKAFSWDKAIAQDNNPEAQRGATGTASSGNNDLAHSLTSFSPTTTTAGTGSELTIYGSGFGSSQGSSYVQFRDADDNEDYMNASSYTSWSDTEIKVKVPSGAGTGKVKVIVNGSSKTTSGTLTINYNLVNAGNVFIKMIDDNGNGGYTFTMRSDFASSSGGSVFRTAVQQWICNTGVNWTVNGANTSIDEVASDGVNVVRWDNKGELTGGTLGVTTTFYSCNEAAEIDITFDTEETDWWEINFNNGLVWYYNTSGNCPSGKYDFYSVALHELGHACRQGHVIKSGDMMHYTMSDGQDNEDFVQEITIAGGQDAVSRSSSGNCSSGMTPMYCTQPTVTLSAGATGINENGSTTVSATLSAAYYDTVTVNIGFSGTATLNTDYTLSTTLKIAPGATSASATLASIDDSGVEGNEAAIIDITSVTNGAESGVQQETVTIYDNDIQRTVTLTTGLLSVPETNTTVNGFEIANSTTITATISTASGTATTVNIGYSGTATRTTDYTTSSSITIPAGSTSASITVSSKLDVLNEDNETIIIDITSVTNAIENGTQQKTITILDDDAAPTVSIAWSKTSIGEAITGNSNAVVTLSAVSGRIVTVTLAFSNTATLNSDYTITGSSITIPAGSTSGYVTMNNIPDTIYEGNENITVDIATVTNATEVGYQNASMTINDDDAPPTGRTSGVVAAIEPPSPAKAKMDVAAGPNPFSTQLTVRNLTSGSTLQLADMNGMIISTVKVNNSAMTINTSSLKAGVYFLKINGAYNGQKQTIKLMKQ